MVRLLAWSMVRDAEYAMYQLEKAVDEPSGNWRVPYLAAVSLWRAIGHVLEKVDAAKDPAVKELVDKAWPHWQRDPTFKILEHLRNKALKEYDFSVEPYIALTWSGPNQIPEDAADARHMGFLMFKGQSADAVEFLWSLHNWWLDRIAAIEHLTSGTVDDERVRKRLEDRLLGRC